VKPARIIPFVIIPLLIACIPKQPEISLPAVPPRPLIEALEQRRLAFTGLKAVASVDAVRSGSRRSYETVGIVIDGQRRLRVEVYGPLGQSLMTLVWDGGEVLLQLEDGRVVRPGQAGLKRFFGVAMDAGELCAVLTGNLPASGSTAAATAFRDNDGSALVVLREGEAERRISVMLPETGPAADIRIAAEELYRSGRLAYRVRYGAMERISQYLIAKAVEIESGENKTSLTIVYNDAEVNTPLPADAFILSGGETGAPLP